MHTSCPLVICRSSSSSPAETLSVTSRMTFLSVALSVVASEDRSLTNLLCDDCCSDSDSCSKSRFWEAMLVPVTISAHGILSPLEGVVSEASAIERCGSRVWTNLRLGLGLGHKRRDLVQGCRVRFPQCILMTSQSLFWRLCLRDHTCMRASILAQLTSYSLSRSCTNSGFSVPFRRGTKELELCDPSSELPALACLDIRRRFDGRCWWSSSSSGSKM